MVYMVIKPFNFFVIRGKWDVLLPSSVSNRRIPTLFFEPSLVSWWRGLFCLVLSIGREALAKQLPVDRVVAFFLSDEKKSAFSLVYIFRSKCPNCPVHPVLSRVV